MVTGILILCATVVVSLVSLVGILLLRMQERLLRRVSFVLVALAAGALVGGAFFHLIPEALNLGGESTLVVAAMVSCFSCAGKGAVLAPLSRCDLRCAPVSPT
jgi:zinc and cadmium transporter